MRIEINQKLYQRNKRIATYLVFANFIVLVGASVVSFLPLMGGEGLDPEAAETNLILLLPLLVLPVVLVIALISVRMTNLWLRQPRPEIALKEGLKGLSNKSVLYNYFYLPARHVLICPQGVFALDVKYQDGSFSVNGDQWTTHGGALSRFLRFFRRDQIGRPEADARQAAAHVQALIEPLIPDIQVQPLIVFTDPKVQVAMENPSVPILFADPKREPNLKNFLRDIPKEVRQTLQVDQIEAFEEATLPG